MRIVENEEAEEEEEDSGDDRSQRILGTRDIDVDYEDFRNSVPLQKDYMSKPLLITPTR